MKKLFNEEQQNYIILNYNTMQYKDIAKHLGDYTANQITGWLHNNGYNKIDRSIFSDSDKEFIINNYKTMNYKDISDKLGFTERQIRGWINNNCGTKLREFNKNYFTKIDTPTKSYWLGFIYADGWVCSFPERRNYELGIELIQSDRYHLEKFNSVLGGVHKITDHHYENIFVIMKIYQLPIHQRYVSILDKLLMI